MKTWLAKFRISTALDSSAPGREELRRARVDGDEIRRCKESLHSLDRRFKNAPPKQPVPASLHASVMRAVRAAAESTERRRAARVMRWLPAPALATLVVIGLWTLMSRRPLDPSSLTDAATALEQSHQIAQKAPKMVLAPLTQEMNNLNRDFQSAVEFLAASMP